jgi:rubrerythrin
MTENSSSQATGSIETLANRLRGESLESRRGFLQRSAAVGASALALSVAGSNTALAHEAGDDDIEDVDVLNFALTLEHLEYAFYRDGLERFGEETFRQAETLNGFSNRVRGAVGSNFADIRDHEETHVDTLTTVIDDLGGDPVEEACYDFGLEDVDDFLAVAAVLENTGVSAYDGAIDLIESADLLTAGATIATVEARHASYLNLLNGDSPFPAAFDDPKTMQEVLDAAGGFIVDCE